MPPSINQSTSNVQTRADIAGVLDSYARDNSQLVGLKVLTEAPVDARADYYFKRNPGTLLKAGAKKRAPGAAYHRDSTDLVQDTYATTEYAGEAVVDDSEAADLARFFDVATMRAQDKLWELLLSHEKRCADLLFNTTTWPLSGLTGLEITAEWDDAANAIPVSDIALGNDAIQSQTGFMPDTLVVPDWNIYHALCINAQVREKVGLRYTDGNTVAVPDSVLAQALGIRGGPGRPPRVLVGGMKYNAAPDAPTADLQDTWNPEHAGLYITSPSKMLTDICVGKTITWTADGGLVVVETYREEGVRGEVVRVRQNVTEKVTMVQAGFLFGNVTTI